MNSWNLSFTLPLTLTLILSGCSLHARVGQPVSEFVTNQRIIYSDGLHNENTEMVRLGNRILLAFRGGETGQTGSARARILIYESTDDGHSFTPLSEVAMPNDTAMAADDRDIRDPKFVVLGGRLLLFAISRVPGFTYRDLDGQAWTVRAESLDGGRTWTEPVKTFSDRKESGEWFWGFWRFTKRHFVEHGQRHETLWATGYDDGDVSVGLFRSEDGIHWARHAIIISSYDDIPSETELKFLGENASTAVALVRLDNQDMLTDGQTAICTSPVPFVEWECGRRIEQRLDGPTWVMRQDGDRQRNFVFARKHLPCTFKRTAVYELRGNLADPDSKIEVCEIQELKSSGDTAYTALVPLDGNRSLLSWYSSAVDQEPSWLEGQFTPSDIWLANVNFNRMPENCEAPEKKRVCEPPQLPSSGSAFNISGRHLLAMSPVTWPSLPLLFSIDAKVNLGEMNLVLQPLAVADKQPVGEPWTVSGVHLEEDGSFTAAFGERDLPSVASPTGSASEFIRMRNFSLIGKTTSTNDFCGYVEGFVQLLDGPNDIALLAGSTFDAVRMDTESHREPVGHCH